MSEASTLIGYGGRTIGREELALVPKPVATETHRPGPHRHSRLSIRHKANPAPRERGHHRVNLGQARTNGRRVDSQINGRFRLGPVYQLVQSSLLEVTI